MPGRGDEDRKSQGDSFRSRPITRIVHDESIVRQGVDPGLVEWTKGNNFKTRVFPIPANGSRTIRVDYVSHLTSLKDATYRLPLKFKQAVGEFTLRVEVVQPLGKPMIVEGDLAGLEFEPWRQSFVADAGKKDFLPKRDIVFTLPNIERKRSLLRKRPMVTAISRSSRRPPAIGGGRPHRLRQLAMTNGGQYINLQAVNNATAIASLGTDAPQFLGATTLKAESVDGIYPSMPQAWADYHLVCGRLSASEANARLNYKLSGGGRAQEGFLVRQTDAVEGQLLERMWAQTKLADLIVFEEENKAEILALGKQHGIVTPFTSLIVLDSLEQYLEHEICPPKSLPRMRNEYLRQMDTLERQQKKEQEDRFTRVEQMWQERIAWWGKTYKYPKNFKYKERGGGRAANNEPGRAAPGAAAPEEPMDEEVGEEAVGETGSGETARDPFGSRNDDGDEADDSAPAPRAPAMDGPFGDQTAPRGAEALDDQTREGGLQRGAGDEGRQPGIVVKRWTPDTPYLKRLAKADVAYVTYLDLREEYEMGEIEF